MGIFIDEFADPPFEWGEDAYPGTGGEETKALVEDKYDRTMASADELLLTALTSMEEMSQALDDFGERVVTVPTLTTPSLPGSTITVPTIPDDATAFSAMLSRLVTDLVSGATGLDATVEAEIWAREDARLTAQEEKSQLELEQYFSTKAFDLPTGAYAGVYQEFLNTKDKNRLDFNGKIAIEQAELAQKNSQFAISTAMQIKQVLLPAAVSLYGEQTSNQHNLRMQTIELFKAEISKAQLTIQARIAEIETELGGFTAVQSLKERIASTKGNISMQGYASAVGSVNMNASVSHQTGRQQSESFNHSENRQVGYSKDVSFSENHSYEEEPTS